MSEFCGLVCTLYDKKKYNKDRNFSSAELSVLACIDAVVRHSVYSNSNCDWNLSRVIRLILLDSLSNKMYPVDDKYKKIIDEIEYDSSLEAKMAKISINSIENKKETDPVINNFNNNYLKLQKVIRKGHIYWGVKGDRLESILEHIYGTLILAMGIETEYNYKIDFDKILTMLLLHETEEIKIGDLTEWDGVSKEEKKEAKAEAKQEKKDQKAEKKAEKKHDEPEYPAEIAIDDFFKCKIQVARVLACEKVEKSSKLLKFRLGLGKDGERTVVSGIQKWYEPETLVGTQVAVITNLKPAKLAGIESQGMILSALDDNGNLRLVTVGEGVEDGALIG